MNHDSRHPLVQYLFDDAHEDSERSGREESPGRNAPVEQLEDRGRIGDHPVLGRVQHRDLMGIRALAGPPIVTDPGILEAKGKVVEAKSRLEFTREEAEWGSVDDIGVGHGCCPRWLDRRPQRPACTCGRRSMPVECAASLEFTRGDATACPDRSPDDPDSILHRQHRKCSDRDEARRRNGCRKLNPVDLQRAGGPRARRFVRRAARRRHLPRGPNARSVGFRPTRQKPPPRYSSRRCTSPSSSRTVGW